MFKLLITEPWEFGTINGVSPFEIVIKKSVNNNWLIILNKIVDYRDYQTKFLLSKVKQQYNNIDLLEESFESLVLEMAIIPDLNEKNFMDYDLDNCRGGFLTGELSSTSTPTQY